MDQTQAAQLKADFDRDGFVIIRNFFSPEQLDELCERVEAVLCKLPRPVVPLPGSNVTKGLDRMDDYFKELLHNGPQVPVLETLLGKKPEPTTASIFTKDENTQEVHPHSDAMQGGVIWVAIDEANAENGCMHFLKGSDQREEEFAHLSSSTPTDLSDHPDLYECAMDPGDIVFFRPTTVHWSGPNHDGSVRRGFNCFYTGDPDKMFKDLKDKYTEEEWAAIMESSRSGQLLYEALQGEGYRGNYDQVRRFVKHWRDGHRMG